MSEPVRIDNATGETPCLVRWMVETLAGWLGAWDREAFDAYTEPLRSRLAEVEQTIREHRYHAGEQGATIVGLRSRLAGMEAAWRNACERGDKAAARLAEVEALLQEVYDGRQSLMSVGLVYRIGHTLNHRPADSASVDGEK